MTSSQPRSMLCPKCRRLISGDESVCPYCDLKNPTSSWQRLLGRGLNDGDQLLKILIGVNIAMYVLSLLISAGSTGFSLNPLFFLSPDSRSLLLLGASGHIPIDRLHRWWSLISANYLHGSILHIFFNMIALKQLGPLVLQEYGNYRMFIIYTPPCLTWQASHLPLALLLLSAALSGQLYILARAGGASTDKPFSAR